MVSILFVGQRTEVEALLEAEWMILREESTYEGHSSPGLGCADLQSSSLMQV